MSTEVIPTFNKVVVKINPKETTSQGGIILPDASQEEKTEGVVVEVGWEVKRIVKGMTVLFGKYAGDNITVEGEVRKILKETEILAIIRKDV